MDRSYFRIVTINTFDRRTPFSALAFHAAREKTYKKTNTKKA